MSFWDETVPLSPANLNSSTVPVGGIIMYSGVIANLPANWSLCDGTGGTPDLRGRFVVGAEGSYAQGATGGADAVTLTAAQMPAHTHGSAGSHTHTYRTRGPHDEVMHGHPTANRISRGSGATANNQDIAADSGAINSAGAHTHTSVGGGGSHENRPPYYALAYVMRTA